MEKNLWLNLLYKNSHNENNSLENIDCNINHFYK